VSTPAAAGPAATGTPAKPENFGQKMLHGILGALGGTEEVAYSRDADPKSPTYGKLIATHQKSGPGQQWKKIITGALIGGAAGSAERGPGSKGRALAAGFGAERENLQQTDSRKRKQANEDFEAQSQGQVRQAEIAWHNQSLAESSWRLTREKATADSDQIKVAADLASHLAAPGNVDLGVTASFPEFLNKFEPNMKELIKGHSQGEIRSFPNFNPDGSYAGTHLVWVDKAWEDQRNTEPVSQAFMRIGKDGKSETYYQTIPPGGATNGEIATMGQNALVKKTDIRDKEAGIAEKYAQAGKARTDQALASEQLNQLKKLGAIPSEAELANLPPKDREEKVLSTQPPVLQALLRGVLSYHADPHNFPAIIRKGTNQMDRQTGVGLTFLAKPSWTQEKYTQAQKLYNDYAAKRQGTAGGNILFFNTGIVHLGQMARAGERLEQSDLVALNALANEVGAQIGNDPKVVYNNILNILAPEIVKATKGNVTDPDIASVKKGLADWQAPEQRHGVIGANVGLLTSKLQQQKEEDTAVLGEPLDFQYINPSAKAVLQELQQGNYSGAGGAGGGGGDFPVPDPRGVVHHFPNQAAADNFKKLAGIQ
jgi:hypothetical protein